MGETVDGSPAEFHVYEEAISRLSQPLHTLIKGDLSEAKAGCTIWKDVSKETFERFVQFAYTGDYSIPNTREWKTVAEPQKEDTDVSKAAKSKSEEEKLAKGYNSLDELEDRLAMGKRAKKDNKKSKGGGGCYGGWRTDPSEPVADRVLLTWLGSYSDPLSQWLSSTDFQSFQYPLLAPRNIHYHACEPPGHFEHNRSYSNILLSHASLYVLGDLWLIDELKALALYKLHKALCIFVIDDQNATDIVDLARYAYEEEGKGSEGGIGWLRGMVCQYGTLHARELSLCADFLDLIEEGGHFARDFVKFALGRMP